MKNVYLTADENGKVTSYITAENLDDAIDNNTLNDNVVCEITVREFKELQRFFKKVKARRST